MVFGKEVRRRREARKLTLEKLAAKAGLSPNYLGGVERGDRIPSLKTVLALAKGLDVTPGELLGGVEGLTPEGIEVARLFEGMGNEDRIAVLQLIKSLSKRKR